MKHIKDIVNESLLDDEDEIMDKAYKSSYEYFKDFITDPKSYRKLTQGSFYLDLASVIPKENVTAIFNKIGIKNVDGFSIMIKKVDEYVGWDTYEKRWEIKIFIYQGNNGFSSKTSYRADRVSFPKLLSGKFRDLLDDQKSFKNFCENRSR